MDLNRDNLEALFKTYSTAWQEGLQTGNADDYRIAVSEFPSSSASNFYAWLDQVPGFRKWVGDRVYQNLRGQRFEVLNETYEDSLRLSTQDLEDDQYGVYTPIVRMMAYSWQELKRLESVAVFTGNRTTFTGQPLFSASHQYGDYALNNLTTSALSKDSFEAAFLAAAGWKFSSGALVKPRFTHLVVGEKLRGTAYSIVRSHLVQAGAGPAVDNPNEGRTALLVWPELTGDYDDYWFLLDAGKPVKPVALQVRKEPVPLMETDPAVIERQGYVDFLASGRLAAAPTFPHLVYGGIL